MKPALVYLDFKTRTPPPSVPSVAVLLPANQRNDTTAAQPTRFSGRKPNNPMQSCLTSVAAARLFSSSVCMSSNAVDASFTSPKGAMYYKSPFSILLANFDTNTPGTSMTITDTAIKIRSGEFCREAKQPFRAFKLATPGHVAIALWDLEKGVIEVFDSSGSNTVSDPSTIMQEQILKKLFAYYPGPAINKIEFPNLSTLQEASADVFCQTWIYWYVYQRTINKKSAGEALYLAHSLPPQQRLAMITDFWHHLASQT